MFLSVVDGGWRRQVWLLSIQDLLRQDETRGQPAGILEFYNNGFGSIVLLVDDTENPCQPRETNP